MNTINFILSLNKIVIEMLCGIWNDATENDCFDEWCVCEKFPIQNTTLSDFKFLSLDSGYPNAHVPINLLKFNDNLKTLFLFLCDYNINLFKQRSKQKKNVRRQKCCAQKSQISNYLISLIKIARRPKIRYACV